MVSLFENLSKILNQEKQRGYDNRTVLGGLERLSDTWAPRAVTQVGSIEDRLLIEEIAGLLRHYPDLEAAGRVEMIETILAKIADRLVPHPAYQIPRRADAPGTGHEAPVATASRESAGVSVATPEEITRPVITRPVVSRPAGDWTSQDAPVTRLPGIKKAYAEKLANLRINTVGDMLAHYPHRYIDYRTLKTINQLRFGEEVTILGTVWECHARNTRRGTSIVHCTISDRTGAIEATWFNQEWLVGKLEPGTSIVISGKVDQYLGRLVFQHPEWEVVDRRQIHTGRLVPVYPLTEGITQKWLRDQINRVVESAAPRLPDHLPVAQLERLGMPSLAEATRQIHFPDSLETLEAAHRRLAFDELLFIQLGVLRQRHQWRAQPGRPVCVDGKVLESFIASLPFQLTDAQQKVLREIISDLGQSVPMNRLLQGDVGSGKTIVALAAMLVTAADGGQSAIMAPTEILAEQHYRNITRLLEAYTGTHPGLDLPVYLLTGSVSAGQRDVIYTDIASGKAKLLVGTHALIQEAVDFNDLRLVIIDEQHRFGVQQRTALRSKGYNPHVLVMSATPIPRSLALTLYGDLDLSVIDEMPPGRQEIRTRWLSPIERERAYSFIRSQVEQGRQAFIICPLVEESEKIEAKSAVEEHARLAKEVFPDLELGLVHGRMSAEEKDAVMTQFRSGTLHILVSTAVVEVGIDVPNATVMLVEGANRFGLAQLHQFRGRVGRGEYQSWCLLLADSATPEAEARLRIISETNDGFKLAEEDLKMRGPGEFFGTRQSGLPDIRVARLSDINLLHTAREEAQEVFRADPSLSQPEHQLLAQKVKRFWQRPTDLS
jgi:ATP-dependent DNA helicase RecG